MGWWTNPAIKVLRWLVFIPLAFLLLAIVGAAWGLAIDAARQIEINTLLGIVIVVILVTSLPLFFLFVTPYFLIPYGACGLVAPNPKVGSVILGTLYVLFQGMGILGGLSAGKSGWWVLGHTLVAIIVMVGVVAAYNQDPDK